MKVSDCFLHYYYDYLEKEALAPRRAVNAWDSLKLIFGEVEVKDITPALVNQYITTRKAKPPTIRRDLIVLRACLNYALKCGHISHVPYIAMPPNSLPRERVLDNAEIQRFLAECTENNLNAFVRIALLSGQRESAILGLKWSQVNFDKNIVDFNTPGGSRRMKGRAAIPMPTELRELLWELHWLHAVGGEDRHVIGGGQKPARIGYHFKLAAHRARLIDVTPHVLRHTVATRLVERGVPLLEVSRLLGHKSIRITEAVYLKYAPEFMSNAVSKLTLKEEKK